MSRFDVSRQKSRHFVAIVFRHGTLLLVKDGRYTLEEVRLDGRKPPNQGKAKTMEMQVEVKEASIQGKEVKEEKKKVSYHDIAAEANKPVAMREGLPIGRSGKKAVPRRYHMHDEKFEEIQKVISKNGKFVSPFRKGGGSYNAIVEALISLGENERHRVYDVYEAFQEYLKKVPSRKRDGKNAWEDFDEKENRNELTGRDSFGRFLQNVHVLQRLGGANQYGFKLAQLGACIDILKDSEEDIYLCLRTGITGLVTPVRQTRIRMRKGVSGINPGPVGFNKFEEEKDTDGE